ncbi:MAG: chromate resistance protein ChrB domain-containing protein [Pseudomonadota bacterium]
MNVDIVTWILIVLTLPTQNATARMRIWRGLKGLGCAALRDGAWLLPETAATRQGLETLADETRAAGGTAWLLRLDAEDAQSAAFSGMFDRAAEYIELLADMAHFDPLAENVTTANKTLKALRRRYEILVEQDYFPGASKLEAEARLLTLEATLASRLSPNEPHFQDGQPERLTLTDFQKKTWATRQDLWVDRLASAWLIRRFIDRKARFVWLKHVKDCPENALGFDFDGARFTHIGHRVTFETLLASFGLENDAALMRIGAIVHALDVGGDAPEAAGFEMLLKGLKARIQDDNTLLKQGGQMLDDLYAVFTDP